MNVAVLILTVLLGTPAYKDLEGFAITHCPLNKRPTEAQQERIHRLFEIEREEKVPGFARGLLAAAACRESSYKIRVGCGDDGASCGMFQFSRGHWRGLRRAGATTKDPRDDFEAGARYWIRLLKRMIPKAHRDCKGRGGYPSRDEYIWASANKTATWKYKCRKWGRCIKCTTGKVIDGECLGGTVYSERLKKRIEVKCEKRACVSQQARCSVPPWRWRKKGKHRRQETRHWMLKRQWHEVAPALEEAPLR